MVPANPTVDFAYITDRTRLNQFDDAVDVVNRVSLNAELSNDLLFLRRLRHDTSFFDRVCHRFFAIQVLAQLHRHHRGMEMSMVGRTDDDRINLILHLIVHAPEIVKLPCFRKALIRIPRTTIVHVAQGHDILALDTIQVGRASAADTNNRDIQLFVSRSGLG